MKTPLNNTAPTTGPNTPTVDALTVCRNVIVALQNLIASEEPALAKCRGKAYQCLVILDRAERSIARSTAKKDG